MKIAVLSDIHGNLPALKAVIDDISRQHIDEIYSLGDQVGFFPNLGEALDLLDRSGVICLLGNHEESNIEYQRCDEDEVKGLWYHKSYRWIVNQQGRRDFSALPRSIEIERAGVRILMTHKEEWAECPEGGLHLFGHTHKCFYHRGKNRCSINPGSVGDPVGSLKAAEAHYVSLDIRDGIVQATFHAVPYAIEPIWNDFIASGCYEVDPVMSRLIMEMMETGVSNAIFGRYLRQARDMMRAEGIDGEHITREIWERTANIFDWRLPDKFETLCRGG